MATWGPSNKRDQPALPAGRDTTPAKSSGGTGTRTRTRATADTEVQRARFSRDDETGGRNRVTDTAKWEFRRAIAGREDEFAGLVMIVVGVIVGAAVYFDLAGILGSGIVTLVGWIVGVGRYVVPVALVVVGIAFIHPSRTAGPWRLAFGISFLAVAILGLIHVANGPNGISADGIDQAGGVVGALVAEPLRTALANFGAVVILLALALVGCLLISQASLRTWAERTGKGATAIAKPIGNAARKALRDLSSLSSDGADDDDDDEFDEDAEATRALPALPAAPYDGDGDLDELGDAGSAPSRAGRRTKSKPVAPAPAPAATDAEHVGAPGAGEWQLPPVTLLKRSGTQSINEAEVAARGQVLEEALRQHGVDTTLSGMTIGPTVTRYQLELGPGVKVARVTSLQKDIAYALAATDVRLLAPIPGQSAIGVEVPNHKRQLVALGDLMVSPEEQQAKGVLDVAVGKDIAGKAVFLDLATTPHLLIAGSTGAGKSSGINCILTSLLMRTTPDQVRLILVDPKQVEMGQYNRLPHLLTQPVTNPKKAANALGWAVKEMDRRYDVLSEKGFRDIGGYNAAFDRGELQPETLPSGDPGPEPERMAYIVVVVDELNDLMMVAARDVEDSITRIAQKARAVGIHLIVATQRPSVNVITGVIKANIPARMAFAVASLQDSRVILDQPGAEKLVGKGDMLLLPGNTSVANRIQGSWVGEDEVRAVADFWRAQSPQVSYVSGVDGDAAPAGGGGAGAGPPMGQLSLGGLDDEVTSSSNSLSGGDDDDDAMMQQAMELVVRSQLGSTSMLQRKLKVGFARAGRIMDLLEQRGVVGPSEGSKARAVLMTVEEFEQLHPN